MYLPCGVQKYIWKTGSIYGGAYFDSNNTNSTVKTDKIRRKRHMCGLLDVSKVREKPRANLTWTFSATPVFQSIVE